MKSLRLLREKIKLAMTIALVAASFMPMQLHAADGWYTLYTRARNYFAGEEAPVAKPAVETPKTTTEKPHSPYDDLDDLSQLKRPTGDSEELDPSTPSHLSPQEEIEMHSAVYQGKQFLKKEKAKEEAKKAKRIKEAKEFLDQLNAQEKAERQKRIEALYAPDDEKIRNDLAEEIAYEAIENYFTEMHSKAIAEDLVNRAIKDGLQEHRDQEEEKQIEELIKQLNNEIKELDALVDQTNDKDMTATKPHTREILEAPEPAAVTNNEDQDENQLFSFSRALSNTDNRECTISQLSDLVDPVQESGRAVVTITPETPSAEYSLEVTWPEDASPADVTLCFGEMLLENINKVTDGYDWFDINGLHGFAMGYSAGFSKANLTDEGSVEYRLNKALFPEGALQEEPEPTEADTEVVEDQSEQALKEAHKNLKHFFNVYRTDVTNQKAQNDLMRIAQEIDSMRGSKMTSIMQGIIVKDLEEARKEAQNLESEDSNDSDKALIEKLSQEMDAHVKAHLDYIPVYKEDPTNQQRQRILLETAQKADAAINNFIQITTGEAPADKDASYVKFAQEWIEKDKAERANRRKRIGRRRKPKELTKKSQTKPQSPAPAPVSDSESDSELSDPADDSASEALNDEQLRNLNLAINEIVASLLVQETTADPYNLHTKDLEIIGNHSTVQNNKKAIEHLTPIILQEIGLMADRLLYLSEEDAHPDNKGNHPARFHSIFDKQSRKHGHIK